MQRTSPSRVLLLAILLVLCPLIRAATSEDMPADPVTALVTALESGKTDAALPLRDAIAAAGDRGVDDLRLAFSDRLNPSTQSALAQLLQVIGSPKAVSALARLALASDMKIRPAVTRALAKTTGPITLTVEAQNALMAETRNSDLQRSADAIVILSRETTIAFDKFACAWESRLRVAIERSTQKDRLSYLTDRAVFIQLTSRAILAGREEIRVAARKRLGESEDWRTDSLQPWRDVVRGLLGESGVRPMIASIVLDIRRDEELRYFAILALGKIGQESDRGVVRGVLSTSVNSNEDENILILAARQALREIDDRLGKKKE